VFAWLLFTVTFAIWWFKFSIDHISTLAELQPAQMAHWQRQRRMVFWEGTTWLVLLVGGGAALIALVQKEKRRVRQIRQFFASFSHEVKTALASLRLQAEALADDWPAGESSPVLRRLIADTVRLQLQLENSLFLSSQDELKLYVEDVDFGRLIERMREQWPGVRIEQKGGAFLRGDERALRTIVSNLLKNSLSHGGATRVTITAEGEGDGRVRLAFQDDGRGFSGAVENLGGLFHRPSSSSGSGLGLYICRLLVERMDGRLNLPGGDSGFRVEIVLPGELE
jgi:signal transduction histidine kinase